MTGVSAVTREHVQRLEDQIAAMPQCECPVRNHFAPGVYLREMTIPAGVTAVGAVHKTEHLAIVVGHCLVTTDDGVQEIRGYAVVHAKPGIKRAAHAIADTVFTTIHATEETDLEKLCELLTHSKADELLGGKNNRQALAQKGETLCLLDS